MHAQQNEAGRLLLHRDLEPAERLVHIAKARVHGADAPGRDDTAPSRRRELGENAPRLVDVSGGGLQVGEAERRAGHAPRERAPRFVRRAAPRRSGRALRASARGRCGRRRSAGRARSTCDMTARPSRTGARSSTRRQARCGSSAESGSRLTDFCTAATASSWRSKEESARASMLCARASPGFNSMARRSDRMPSRRSPVWVWTMAERGVRIGECRIQFERAPRRRGGLCRGLRRRRHAPDRADDVAIGERRPRARRNPGRSRGRAWHAASAEVHPFARSGQRRVSALQVLEVRLRVHDVAPRQVRGFAWRQLHRDLACDFSASSLCRSSTSSSCRS